MLRAPSNVEIDESIENALTKEEANGVDEERRMELQQTTKSLGSIGKSRSTLKEEMPFPTSFTSLPDNTMFKSESRPVKKSISPQEQHQQTLLAMSGTEVKLQRPRTNEALLKAHNPSLLKRQDIFLQRTREARREQYCKSVWLPYEKIPKWSETDISSVLPPAVKPVKKSSKSNDKNNGDTALTDVNPPKRTVRKDLNEKISLYHGDVTVVEVDAMVNSTNERLAQIGIMRQLFAKIGDDLEQEVTVLRKDNCLKVDSSAVITCGYSLPAYYIIHVNVQECRKPELLASCYINALETAMEWNIRTIAFPCMGSGGFALFTPDKAARIALATVRDYLENPEQTDLIDRIVFCTYQDDSQIAYKKYLTEYFPLCDPPLESVSYSNFFANVFGNTYYPLSDLQEKVDHLYFRNMTTLSLQGADFLNDMFFWFLNKSGVVVETLKTLDLTGCCRITDMAAVSISKCFPNAENICLTGCVNLTEYSLKFIGDRMGYANLKSVSMVATSVKVVPIALETNQQLLLKLNGCPLIAPIDPPNVELSNPIKTLSSMKVVIVRSNDSKSSVFDDFPTIQSNQQPNCGIRYAQYTHTDTTGTVVNIFDIKESYLPLFLTPGTTFIIDGQDQFPAAVATYIYQNCIDPTIYFATNGGQHNNELIGVAGHIIGASLKKTTLSSNFAQQLLVASVCRLQHMITANPPQEQLTIGGKQESMHVIDYASSCVNLPAGDMRLLYSNISKLSLVEDVKAKLVSMGTTKLFITVADILSQLNPQKTISDRSFTSVLEILNIMGFIIMSKDKKLIVVDIPKLIELLEQLSLGLNSDGRYGKLIPWLKPGAKVFKLGLLETYVEDEKVTMADLQEFLSFQALTEPWMSMYNPEPSGVLNYLMPSKPAISLDHFCPPDMKSSDDFIQQHLNYSSPLSIPMCQTVLDEIIAELLRIGLPALIWKNGIVIHQGPTEVVLQKRSAEELLITLRTMKVESTADYKDLLEKNVKQMLNNTAQLVRMSVEFVFHKLGIYFKATSDPEGSDFPPLPMHKLVGSSKQKICSLCRSDISLQPKMSIPSCQSCGLCAICIAHQSEIRLTLQPPLEICQFSNADYLTGSVIAMGLAPMIVSFPLKVVGRQSAFGSIRFTPIRYVKEIRICIAPNQLEDVYNVLDGNFYPVRTSLTLKELGGEVGDEFEVRLTSGNENEIEIMVNGNSVKRLLSGSSDANILFTKLDASLVIHSCTPWDIYDPKGLSIDQLCTNLLLEVKTNDPDTDKIQFYTAKIVEFTPEGQLVVAPLSSDSNVAKQIFHLSDDRLRPFNFCASHNLHADNQAILTYEECLKRFEFLTGIDSKDLVALMYFTEKQSQGTTHKSLETSDRATVSSDTANPFEIGMRLEAKDRLNLKMIAVAYVSDVQGSKLKISFDGRDSTDTYDYWCDYRSTDIHPVGYCEFHRVELCAPGKTEGQDFHWASYLRKRTLTAAPPRAFSVEQSAGCPPFDMLELFNGLVKRMYFSGPFYYGMRLEAVDRKHPNLICVAHVEDVEQNQLKIAFDGRPKQYDYWCPYDCEYIHPVGYCKHKELVLSVPKDMDSSSFNWESYLRENTFVPAPHTEFTEVQTGGCPKFQWSNTHKTFRTNKSGNKWISHRPNGTTCEVVYLVETEINRDLFNESQKIANLNLGEGTYECDGPESSTFSLIYGILPKVIADGNETSLWPARRFAHSHNLNDHNFTPVCYANDIIWPFPPTLNVDKEYLHKIHNEHMVVCHYILNGKILGGDRCTNALVKNFNNMSPTEIKATATALMLLISRSPFTAVAGHIRKMFPFYKTDNNIAAVKATPQLYESCNRYSYLYYSTIVTLTRSFNDATNPVGKLQSLDVYEAFKTVITEDIHDLPNVFQMKTPILGELFGCPSHRFKHLNPREYICAENTELKTEFVQSITDVQMFVATNYQSSNNDISWDPGCKPPVGKADKEDKVERLTVANVDLNQSCEQLCKLDPSGFQIFRKIVATSYNVTSVSLVNMGLTSLLPELEYLRNTLKALILDRNPLTIFPKVILKLTNLTVLSLSACALKRLPKRLGRLKQLCTLDLSINCYKELPSSMGQLKKLEMLDISGIPWYDRTTSISWSSFRTDINLKTMLKYKRMTDEELAKYLAAAEISGVYQNGMIENPDDLKKLNQLIATDFPRISYKTQKDGEHSYGFPNVLLELESLETLKMSYCELVSLPRKINRLRNLTKLDLTSNSNLETLPVELVDINLQVLSLQRCGNLTTPPPDVVKRGVEAVLYYLRRMKMGQVECKRTKLMMVGLGGSGKTSLVRALQNENLKTVATNESEAITDGIDIADWTVRAKDNDIIQYNIWDFAGQAVYYNTHQFFLSNRAIYFLLWNTRLGFEHAGLEFWLSSISCHAAGAPIFVIGTHADKVQRVTLPTRDLQQTFPNIVHFCYISAITGEVRLCECAELLTRMTGFEGVYELVQKLFEVTAQQPYMKLKVPKIYLDFEKEILLKRKSCKVLEIGIVAQIARKHQLDTLKDVREAVNFLHQLGSIQYFPKDTLRDRVVISPQWLVDVMACLISVKKSVIEDGRFKYEQIKDIWKDYPADMQDWLLKLTEEFDLCFQLPSGTDYIVPCLLPEQEPKIEWPLATDPNVKKMKNIYKFHYLPAGMFNRTQTRLCQFSDSDEKSGELPLWKNGSKLVKNGHFGLIRQTKNNEIVVKVQGRRPENMLMLIHEVIDTLATEGFPGVKFDLLVPCLDCVKQGTADPYLFSSASVKRATDLKAPFLQCTTNFHIVTINALHSLMPPSSFNDFRTQLNFVIRELDDAEVSENSEVSLLCHSADFAESDRFVAGPKRLQTDLTSKLNSTGMSVQLITEKNINRISTVINSPVIIVCVTEKFSKSVDCTNLVAYMKRQTHKQLIPALLVDSNDWQQSNVGMLFSLDLRVDFWDPNRYENRLSELITRILARKICPAQMKQKSFKFPPVFISYCWYNSARAVELGRKFSPQAIGDVDPREIKDFLGQNGVECWLDVDQTGKASLFEDIAEGLRHAKLVLACVSDEYLLSQACMQEFRFSTGILKIPMILCPVGKGNNWQTSEIAFLALNCPRVDCQVKRDSEQKRLLKLVRETLKLPPIPTGNSDSQQKSSKTEEKKSVAEPFEVYQELIELAERKFLQQISLLAPKIRNNLGLWDVYPRLFFLDLLEKPSENSRSSSHILTQSNTVIRLGCEDEKGWHVVEKNIKFDAAVVTDDFEKILDEISTFQVNLLTIMKHSARCDVNLLLHPNANDIVKNFEERAKKGPTLEQSYSKLTEIVYKLDVGRVRGEMLRCYLPSRKLVWLCRHHQSCARATLPNDVIEADDVELDNIELTVADIDANPKFVSPPTTPISKTKSNANSTQQVDSKIENPPPVPAPTEANPSENAKPIERPRRSSIRSFRSSYQLAINSSSRTDHQVPMVIIQPAATNAAREKKLCRLCLIV